MAYSDIDKPSDYFDTLTWSGDNTSPRSLTGLDFQPDWVWIKRRSAAKDHGLFDSVRGGTKKLESNTSNAEIFGDNGQISSFNSDGFSVITGTADNSGVNATSSTYVGWSWLGGGTASSNTDGSITSQVSANTTSGFSIVSYTGTGATGTIGHGLSSTPDWIILKNRDASTNWIIYHKGIPNSPNEVLFLNLTNEATDQPRFNDTSPTASVFSIGSGSQENTSGDDYVAYCFAEKKSFSKFGSYTGNGSTDGPFVYTGFKPAFVITKEVSGGDGGSWILYDNKRTPSNVVNKILLPNGSNAEITLDSLDLLSNGFKIRTTNTDINTSSANHIYMAFAENPLVTSTGVPCTAR